MTAKPNSFVFEPPFKKWGAKPQAPSTQNSELLIWLNNGLLAAIHANSSEDVKTFIRLGADPFLRREFKNERRQHPLEEALKTASLEIVVACWEAGQKIHPGASFEGHFSAEELDYEAKKRFRLAQDEGASYTWNILEKFLPKSLTLLALENDRPDVLCWCLENGASPYPRSTNSDDQSTHRALKREIVKYGLEKLGRAMSETTLKYIGPDVAMSEGVKSSLSVALYLLEHVAPRLPDGNVLPLVGLEGPIGKEVQFSNAETYFSNFSGFYAYAHKHHGLNLKNAASAIGIDRFFRALNTCVPDWLSVSTNGEESAKGFENLTRATIDGIRNVDFEAKKAVQDNGEKVVNEMMQLSLSGTSPTRLKNLFQNEEGVFFEFIDSSFYRNYCTSLKAWVERELLNSRHENTKIEKAAALGVAL